jgi:hypothetical protein
LGNDNGLAGVGGGPCWARPSMVGSLAAPRAFELATATEQGERAPAQSFLAIGAPILVATVGQNLRCGSGVEFLFG